jgi:predicted adenylyl cyclase CyaB
MLMPHINIEIKARTSGKDKIREILKSLGAEFKGVDHQVDTYFRVNKGRLKLREGNIENHLIYYTRADVAGPKKSTVLLNKNTPGSNLKQILLLSLDILATVDKQREIYFIDNVKFHLDEVNGLGNFVEIEAIDVRGACREEELFEQCSYYVRLFGLNEEELVRVSYCDLLLAKN